MLYLTRDRYGDQRAPHRASLSGSDPHRAAADRRRGPMKRTTSYSWIGAMLLRRGNVRGRRHEDQQTIGRSSRENSVKCGLKFRAMPRTSRIQPRDGVSSIPSGSTRRSRPSRESFSLRPGCGMADWAILSCRGANPFAWTGQSEGRCRGRFSGDGRRRACGNQDRTVNATNRLR